MRDQQHTQRLKGLQSRETSIANASERQVQESKVGPARQDVYKRSVQLQTSDQSRMLVQVAAVQGLKAVDVPKPALVWMYRQCSLQECMQQKLILVAAEQASSSQQPGQSWYVARQTSSLQQPLQVDSKPCAVCSTSEHTTAHE